MEELKSGQEVASKTLREAGRGLSLVMPAYNEQDGIASAVREADCALRQLVADRIITRYEIIVVDDGSADSTAERTSRLKIEIASLRLVRHESNRGYGAALQSGFEACKEELIAFTDADCQFRLLELDRLLLLAKDYDFVCGYRIDRRDPWPRLVYSKSFNLACRFLLGSPVRDVDCALKVMKRDALRSIPLESNGFFVNAEMLSRAVMAQKQVIEVGVSHRPRLTGSSTVSPWQVLPVGAALLRFWWQVVAFPERPIIGSKGGPARWSRGRELTATILLIVAALFLLLPNLSYPLFEPDEMRYGQIAIEMHESGDWITPRLMGEPYLDKPPLTYWLTAASYGLFGQSEASTRLPSVLSGVLTVLASFFLGRRLVGSSAAWLGALSLLLCGGFVFASRFLLLDGPFSLFVTCSLLALSLAIRGKRVCWRWWILGAVSMGLACLAKGPAAVVLVAPPLAASWWLAKNRTPLRWRHFAVFFLVFATIALPWFAAISFAQPSFLEYFFWKHNFVRFVAAFDHEQPWWFYLPVLAVALLPASVALPWTAKFLFSRRRIDRERRTPEHGFLFLWATWIVLFFSFSSCKLPAYVLPALPPLCLLIGCVLAARWKWEWAPNCGTKIEGWEVARLTTAAIGIAAIADWVILPASELGRIMDPIVALVAAVSFALLGRIPRLSPRAVWAATACLGYFGVAFAICDVVPEISIMRSVHAAAENSLEDDNGTKHPTIVYWGRQSHAAHISLPNEVVLRMQPSELTRLRSLIRRDDQVMIITRPNLVASLQSELATAARLDPVDGRRDLFVARELGTMRSSDGDAVRRVR